MGSPLLKHYPDVNQVGGADYNYYNSCWVISMNLHQQIRLAVDPERCTEWFLYPVYFSQIASNRLKNAYKLCSEASSTPYNLEL